MRTEPENVPSLKSTSGAGYTFEDEVAAVFLIEMLTEKPSLVAEWGVATQLQRQAQQFAPHDDILLTLLDDGEPFVCAVSVKSNLLCSLAGLTPDAVRGAWQVLDAPAYDRQTDKVAIASQPINVGTARRIHDLLRRSYQLEPVDLEQSLRGDEERCTFDTFSHSPSGEPPGELARRMAFRDTFDFESSTSLARSEAIRLCSVALAPEDDPMAAADELWKDLLFISSELRTTGGAISTAGLIQRLKARHRLVESNHDRSAWEKLRLVSGAAKDAVSPVLPTGQRVPRGKLLDDIGALAAKHPLLAIVGESGSGKSCLASLFVSSNTVEHKELIWLAPPDIDRLSLFAQDFVELVGRCRRPGGVLVLDGAEHWTAGQFVWLKSAINGIGKLDGWLTLITCQHHDWERVQVKLAMRPKTIECPRLHEDEVALLAATNSTVASLVRQKELKGVIRSPLMLKVMLEAPSGGQEATALWKSETDIIAWWWRDRICDGRQISPCGSLARRIAEQMADQLETELPDEVARDAEDAASALISRGVLAPTVDGRLRFTHDLYADWCRLQGLRQRRDDLLQFAREHIENPPWFRTLRLHCQQLLENPNDHQRWLDLISPIIDQAAQEDHPFKPGQPSSSDLRILDAALDAIAFCSTPDVALQGVKQTLFEHNCSLLRRLLRCMSHSATQPDIFAIEQTKQHLDSSDEEALMLARWARLPTLHLWLPVIQFLASHHAEAVPCVSAEIAVVTPMFETFVRYLRGAGMEPAGWWMQLCEIALACAEQELRWEMEGVWRDDDERLRSRRDQRSAIYRAGQMAADMLPKRLVTLAMKAVGRIKWDRNKDLPSRFDEGWFGECSESGSSFSDDWLIVRPIRSWPHGPRRKISHEFADEWLNGGWQALARHQPRSAAKIILASMIAWPKRNIHRSELGGGLRDEQHGFRFLHKKWFPPFWHHGPFLLLLRKSREHGLGLVIKLVNFATDRVAEWWPYESDEHVPLAFDSPVGRVEWLGHPNVYGWNHYDMNTVEPVTCALMALEKWLMEELEAKREVQDVVHRLFKEGRSIAFAGLLVCVGKAYPSFLLAHLQPLLAQWHVYLWDVSSTANRFGTGGGWFKDPPFINKLRQEWQNQPHRETRLQELCFRLMFTHPESRGVFLGIAETWRSQAAKLDADDPNRIPLLRWASDFDYSTWRQDTLSDGTKYWRPERPPELFVEAQERHMQLLTLPLHCQKTLEDRSKLTADEAVDWWKVFQRTLEWLKESGVQGDESMSENPQHSVAAIMAVLLCRASEWLNANPQHLEEIETQALELAKTMQMRKAWTAQDLGVDVGWFMVRCAVRLWALRPGANQWRSFCGSATSCFRYEIVRALFDEAFRCRQRLGTGFADLCKFIVAYAGVRGEGETFPQGAMERDQQLKVWHDEWWPKFAEGVLPVVDANWGATLGVNQAVEQDDDVDADDEDLLRQPIPRPGAAKRKTRTSYGFDLDLLLYAFDCLPCGNSLTDANPTEEAQWKTIHDNLYTALLRTLPDETPCDDDDRAPIPYESERTIIMRLAKRMVSMTPEEAEKYWRPLLNKGSIASYFAMDLLSSLKIECLKQSLDVMKLKPLITGMLEHIERSAEWTSDRRQQSGDLWGELLFIGRFVDSRDDETYGPLMVALAPFYERAVRERSGHDFNYSRLIHHLAGKATRPLLPRVFEWCSRWTTQEDGIRWRDSHLRDAFSDLLEAGWKHSFGAIKRNSDAYLSFKAIALALAALQDAVALEVQASIGRRQSE